MSKKKNTQIRGNIVTKKRTQDQSQLNLWGDIPELNRELFNRMQTTEILKHIEDSVDVWLSLAVMIGRQQQSAELLTQIYEKNKLAYYESRVAIFGDKYTYNHFDVATEKRIQKALGIVAYERQQEQYEQTERLLKIGFKSTYNYCVQRKTIHLGDFVERELKVLQSQTHTKVEGISPAMLRNSTIVALFFFLTGKAQIDIIEKSLNGWQLELFMDSVNGLDYSAEWDAKTVYVDLKDELAMSFILKTITSELYKDHDTRGFMEIVLQIFRNKENNSFDRPHPMFNETLSILDIYVTESLTIDGYLDFLLRFSALGVSSKYFYEQQITREKFEQLLCGCIMLYVERSMSVDFLILFIDTLAMSILQADATYMRVHMLQEEEVEQLHVEKESLRVLQEKDDQIAQLQAQVTRLQNENLSQVKNQKDNRDTAVISLRKQVRELEKELHTKDEHAKEVFALREFVFNANKGTEDAELTTSIDYTEALKDMSIVVIGGHDNWINHMRKVLPNALYLNPESSGRDYSRIKQPNTFVFVNTLYNNHGTYYKAVSLLKESDNKLFFIDKTNAQITIQTIYNYIFGS